MQTKNTSPVDVPHLAKLSALTVTKSETATLSKQFSATLKVVKQLASLSTTNVIPTSQVTGQVNRFRDDVIDDARRLTPKQALSNAHRQANNYFIVPAVL